MKTEYEILTLERRKRFAKRPGIYAIINLINFKIYIGSSGNVRNRIKIHKHDLKTNIHNNTHLQRAWNIYGEDNFKFEIICYCIEEDLLEIEQFYINHFESYNYKRGYNKCKIAGRTKGYKYTEEQRKKISDKLKGHSSWIKGLTKETDERVRALSEKLSVPKNYPVWNKGKARTLKEKIKISEARKNIHVIAWNKGLKMPKEVGIKIGEANRKRVWKEESRQKMSLKRTGVPLSQKHCNSISNGLKGHIITDETRQKISNSLKNKRICKN